MAVNITRRERDTLAAMKRIGQPTGPTQVALALNVCKVTALEYLGNLVRKNLARKLKGGKYVPAGAPKAVEDACRILRLYGEHDIALGLERLVESGGI